MKTGGRAQLQARRRSRSHLRRRSNHIAIGAAGTEGSMRMPNLNGVELDRSVLLDCVSVGQGRGSPVTRIGDGLARNGKRVEDLGRPELQIPRPALSI